MCQEILEEGADWLGEIGLCNCQLLRRQYPEPAAFPKFHVCQRCFQLRTLLSNSFLFFSFAGRVSLAGECMNWWKGVSTAGAVSAIAVSLYSPLVDPNCCSLKGAGAPPAAKSPTSRYLSVLLS